MKCNIFLFTLSLGLGISMVSCSSEEAASGGGTLEAPGAYVIAASGEDADYLLQTDDLTKGTITALGNGLESSGNRNWIFHKDAVYSFLYSKGDPGKATSYVLNGNGKLTVNSELDLTISVTTRGYYNDNIVLVNSTRNIDDARGTVYFVDAVKHTRTEPIVIDTKELAEKGGIEDKMAYFTDVAQVDDKLFMSYKVINGTGSGSANQMKVEINDRVFIAVFSYDEATNKLIYERTLVDMGRTNYVNGANRSQAETGISQIETGDTYIFSSSPIDPAGIFDLPSGVLRIKKGEKDFDKDYFFNIEELSGHRHLWRVWHINQSTFVLQMYSEADNTETVSGQVYSFAVVDVEKKTFEWIKGTPDPSVVTAVSKPYVSKEDGTIVFAITTKSELPHIYTINPMTATATKGIEIKASGVAGLGKLHYK